MPKPSDEPIVSPQPEAAAAPVAVTLNEFCMRLSETVHRPELIGAFAFSERAAGNSRDSVDAFQARYEVFVNKPV